MKTFIRNREEQPQAQAIQLKYNLRKAVLFLLFVLFTVLAFI